MPVSAYLFTRVLDASGRYSFPTRRSSDLFLAGSNANGGTSSHVDTFTVAAADGTTKLVSFTIHGTNDAAVIGDPTVRADAHTTERQSRVALASSRPLAISDVDTGEGHFNTTVTPGAVNLGSLVLAANCSYTYSVPNALLPFPTRRSSDLGTSSHVDTFTVAAADGTTKLVSFTIHGTNDAAVIGDPTV